MIYIIKDADSSILAIGHGYFDMTESLKNWWNRYSYRRIDGYETDCVTCMLNREYVPTACTTDVMDVQGHPLNYCVPPTLPKRLVLTGCVTQTLRLQCVVACCYL